MRFHSTSGEFSVLGSTATVTTADGTTWAIDQANEFSWNTGSKVQQIDDPDSSWINHIESNRLYGAGSHDHLYILRTSTQTVSHDVTEAPYGVTANVRVRTDGLTEEYVIRVATSDDPALRESFLTFAGWVSVQLDEEEEIRF